MKQIPNGPSGWLAYVEVDDIRAATKKAKSLGGEIMKDVTEVVKWVGSASSEIRPVLSSDCGSPNRSEFVRQYR